MKRRIIVALMVGLLLLVLGVAAAACDGEESAPSVGTPGWTPTEAEKDVMRTVVAGVHSSPTPEATPAPTPAPEPTPDKQQYQDDAAILLGEADEIIDDALDWMEDILAAYEAGVMFPDTAAGIHAKTRWEVYAGAVEGLDVPDAFRESHGLWMVGNAKFAEGLESTILGCETLDADLVEEGSLLIAEASALIIRAGQAMP